MTRYNFIIFCSFIIFSNSAMQVTERPKKNLNLFLSNKLQVQRYASIGLQLPNGSDDLDDLLKIDIYELLQASNNELLIEAFKLAREKKVYVIKTFFTNMHDRKKYQMKITPMQRKSESLKFNFFIKIKQCK